MMATAAEAASSRLTTETWQALGSTVVVRYQAPANQAVRAAVERELHAIDAAASRFSPDSELSRVNAGAGRRIEVSPLLLEAVALGVRAAQITGGAVDPTLGQSLIAAGYDRDWTELAPAPTRLPQVRTQLRAIDLEPALRRPARIVVRRRPVAAWRRIELGADPPSVRLPPGVTLDLGATAKALAADRAAQAGHLAGDVGVLVSLGGDIATRGEPPETGWQILTTDDHRAPPDAVGQIVSIRSGGLATSSITTRRWSHHGQPMHHIFDPTAGEPVRSCWRTATVAASSCADANIASTAAIVLGTAAAGWLAEQGLPARLVALDGAVRIVGEWPA